MRGKDLQAAVFEIIQNNWPVHVRETIELLNWDPMNITNISKIRYHFNELQRKEMVHTKKIGRALVAWPVEIEKLRIVHELMRD